MLGKAHGILLSRDYCNFEDLLPKAAAHASRRLLSMLEYKEILV